MSERINAYCKPGKDGKGVAIDIEGMMVDLVMAAKAGRIEKDSFLQFAAEIYDKVEVSVTRPTDN